MPPPDDPLKQGHDALAAEFHDATGTAPTGGLPVIQWADGKLPAMVDAAEAALMLSAHDTLFQRGPAVVRVVRRQAMSVRAYKQPAGGLAITPVDKNYLVEQLTRCAHWERYDNRKESWRRVNAPELVAQTYLARSGHWKLPRLMGVISAPTLRPDGTLLQTPGYDEDTATWFDPCGVAFAPVPVKPTKKQVDDAADELFKAVDSLPFVSTCDASVAVSLMLTSLVRRSLPSAPMGAITAPTPGSGKTLLGDCIAILATGISAPAMQFPNTDEEAEKVVLSVLMEGNPVVLIDNVERPLQGAWLCSILTSEQHQGRMLGRNEMVSVPTTTLFLATGNKLVIQGDLRTRTLLCRIDPKHEKPEERAFKTDLRVEFTRSRPKLVAAALTLMRGYLAAGERASVFRPWGRFEQWSKFCREPLMWLGLSDPCESYDLIAQDDPERQEHVQLLSVWADHFSGDARTAREVISAAMAGNGALQDALQQMAAERGGALSAKRLGHWLRARADRIVDGRMFVHAGKDRNGVALWKVGAAKA